MNYVKYPEDFDDYAWELSSKGCFEVQAVVDGETINVNFYDKYRLQQDTELSEELGENFLAENIIVVDVVDRERMDAAIKSFHP
ncbi:hypothetical protein [Parasedimentitalea huanghaiensis]|uniref:Uncharacterized protein n=1 Tax=Parasedimentitalea huanghaiensis TaxID=2682100 RepID=A0A6L6WLW6_9RHOB|nr:hypothetical protein [Zongyanglinia huanghaiensis]MVO18481.1 hypothetical protein [Zongyanglinia huanghaiensis]